MCSPVFRTEPVTIAWPRPGLQDFDVVTVTGDVASAETTAAIVAAAEGRVDGLANVAGIMDAFLPPAEVDDVTWDGVFSASI